MTDAPDGSTSGPGPISAALSPAAERMRRHRERRRGRLLWLGVELRETEVDALVLRGLLPEESRHDRAQILRAFYAFLEQELDCAS